MQTIVIVIHHHHHHHHHHIALVARISLTLSRHSSLSFIALGRSSGQHPVSSHSCWMYVRAGRPAFARPYVEIHKSTSLMSSSLLLQQCPACLVRLTWIVFVIGGRWPYSSCLVGCCCQPFKIYFIATSSSCLMGRGFYWHLCQPGFDPSYGKLVCLATLISSDRTKQICLWMMIYIYIYINEKWKIKNSSKVK